MNINRNTTITIKTNTKSIWDKHFYNLKLSNPTKDIDWDTIMTKIGSNLNVIGGTLFCQNKEIIF